MTLSSIQSVSSHRRKWKYDVFVSFRGEDTRNNFTDHLFGALHKNRIVVFRDDINLKKGGNISYELLQAIEESHILIVIFSKNYASSTWCLQELANIVDCIHVQGQTVLPIFYDVSPSEVRKQTGEYEKPFLEHEERFKGNLEKVQRWRGALTQVANLSGWDMKDKSQYAEIEKIIKKVRSLLGNKTETLPGDIVGMHSQVEELENFLILDSNDDVRVVRKTTLIDKSFITSEMGRICMHDLFKELSKSIVREKSIKEPRKWNRLWDYKDVHNVISDNMVSRPETVELNVTMHCEACAEQLKRKILQMRGVQTAVAEFSTRKVTVTGTMDANKLVDYVYKKTKKQAKIVPKPEPEPEKKEEENKEGEKPADEEEAKPEENEGEKAAAEEEAKPEENEGEKAAAEEKAKPEENEKEEEKPTEDPKKEEGGENKEEMGGEESKEETKKEESGAVVYIDEEGMKRTMYSYEYYPLYVIEPARGPQLFSDENPNACSIS